MKGPLLAGLAAALLTLPRATLGQSATALPASLPPVAERAVLGGPPQPAELAAPVPAEPLNQLPAAINQLARQLAGTGCSQPAFRADVAALAAVRPVAGSRTLVALVLPASAAGVPTGGAAPGQRLRLCTAAGEQLVPVARAAAPGSRVLVVSAAGLAGPAVYVYGLEHPAEVAPDYATLARLHLQATRELAEQLAGLQQQVAELQRQLAASRRLTGTLLLDHHELSDLQQQLSLLRSQQAAALSTSLQRRSFGWLAE